MVMARHFAGGYTGYNRFFIRMLGGGVKKSNAKLRDTGRWIGRLLDI